MSIVFDEVVASVEAPSSTTQPEAGQGTSSAPEKNDTLLKILYLQLKEIRCPNKVLQIY